MKTQMIKTVVPLFSFALLASAASAGSIDRSDTLVSVSRLAATVGPEVPLKDAPATENVARMRNAFRQGAHRALSLGVYELEDVPEVKEAVRRRTAQLSLSGREDPGVDNHTFGITAGGWRLERNALSGAELMTDVARHHRGKGVARGKLLAETDYMAKARIHVERVFPDEAWGQGLYAYKVGRYVDAQAAINGPVTEKVYQVAVAFNTSVDDLPVIGSSGKVAVHMTPAGEVVAYESTLRKVKGRRKTVNGDALLSPDKARHQVEKRLGARGVDLSRYQLVREELGYFRKGRNSVQTVLAPHYGFIYEPLPEQKNLRKLVETIPAVTDPKVLAMIRDDNAREWIRKAELLRNVAPPERK